MKEILIEGELTELVKSKLFVKQREIFDKHKNDEYKFYLKIDVDPVSETEIVFIQVKKGGIDFYDISSPKLQELIDQFDK